LVPVLAVLPPLPALPLPIPLLPALPLPALLPPPLPAAPTTIPARMYPRREKGR
jgi:hypothetical protein